MLVLWKFDLMMMDERLGESAISTVIELCRVSPEEVRFVG
jgi:hypothetical protein